ncbi:MAG: hypothetical protein WEA58_01170 [Balneolaceae bacterium]
MKKTATENTILYLKRICGVLILLLSIAAPALQAQSNDSPRATLKGWESDLKLFIKDRTNNYGGVYYDRGLFRWTTSEMMMEYHIDLFTYGFSYFDDHEWSTSKNGFRSMVGSLNTPEFAVHSELKTHQAVSKNGTVTINAFQQENRQAKRSLFILGYQYRFGENHLAGVSQTLGQKKTDLDATLFYQFGNRDIGFITTEITLLDWFNNKVTGLSEDRQSEFLIRHNYSKKPYLYVLRLESPQIGIFRGEATLGIQPRTEARVSRRELPLEDFIMEDWVNYQAALLEANYGGLTAGIIYQRTFARMQRDAASGSDYLLDFGNRQIQHRGGAYLHYRWKDFGFEQWFFIERNRDHQFDNEPAEYRAQDPKAGGRYPFDFNEVRRWNKSRIFYQPKTGFTAYLEHNGDWRDLGMDGETGDGRIFEALNYRTYYTDQIVSRNERLTLSVGYRFTKNFWLTLGASYDVDGDLKDGFDQPRDATRAGFDGGFGRMHFTW